MGRVMKPGQYAYLEVAAHWAHDAAVTVLPVGTRVRPEQVPPVLRFGSEPYVIRDAADPAAARDQQQIMQALRMRALLGYALVAGSQPVGLLLIAYREPRMFTPAETQPLQALAGQIAVTLRNQQLVREQAAGREAAGRDQSALDRASVGAIYARTWAGRAQGRCRSRRAAGNRRAHFRVGTRGAGYDSRPGGGRTAPGRCRSRSGSGHPTKKR